MEKRFKLRFSFSSFHICRPKHHHSSSSSSSLPKSPLPPSNLLFSPLNSKSFDISFPSFKFPNPPPSTPNHPSPLTTTPPHQDASPSPPHIIIQHHSSPNDQNTPPPITRIDPPPKCSKKTERQKKKPIKGISRRKKNYTTKTNTSKVDTTMKKTLSPESLSAVMSMQPAGLATESFAVVKRSADPYEDFKKSMMEMILEKQMFEAKDLEQLLLCFLSLNSKEYHGVIVKAFTEIWELLFHKSP